MSIVCFGEALIDFLSNGQTPESFTKYAGGAPANVAVAVAKMGGNSCYVGMLGKDMFGDFLLAEFSKYGVDTSYCKQTGQAKTALAFISLDEHGERSFSYYRPPAADLLFRENDFDDEIFKTCRVYHVCSNSLTEEAIYKTTVSGIERAKAHGCLVSFDMNLRENLWASLNHTAQRIWHIIFLAEVVKVSKEELTFLNESSNKPCTEQETIQACLDAGVKCLIVTDGGNELRYATPGFSGVLLPPKSKAVDTTAAGDAFVGGLLYQINEQHGQSGIEAVFATEGNLLEILGFASRCGAFAVTRKGAFDSLPTLADIKTA